MKRGVGIKRATELVEAAKQSVGVKVGSCFGRKELHNLLVQFELYKEQLEELDKEKELIRLPPCGYAGRRNEWI